jgi:hypothetical protein
MRNFTSTKLLDTFGRLPGIVKGTIMYVSIMSKHSLFSEFDSSDSFQQRIVQIYHDAFQGRSPAICAIVFNKIRHDGIIKKSSITRSPFR